MLPGLPIKPSPGSRANQVHAVANGEPLPNMGQPSVTFTTDGEDIDAAVLQCANVTRPLSAIGEICDTNKRVVFGANGGFIYNLENGHCTYFSRRGKLYERDMWIRKPPNSGDNGTNSSDFVRQGS